MSRMSFILAGVLAVQIAGAIALAVARPDYGAYKASAPLVAFDADAVDEIVIDQGKDQSATLRRTDDTWKVTDLNDFPADTEKVTKLLDSLSGLKKGLPVATSDRALSRFRLTEEDHERRIALRGNGELLDEVYFGTSPSYRQVHARGQTDEVVYSVAFAIYDAGARPEDWMDKNYLDVPEDEITRIELPDIALVRTDDGFAVEGLGAGEETVSKEAKKIVDKLTHVAFSGIEGEGPEALARVSDPDLTVTVERKDKDAITYRIAALKKTGEADDKGGSDTYLLASSAHDYLFRASKSAIEPLLQASRDKLVATPSEEEGPAATEGAGGAAPAANSAGAGKAPKDASEAKHSSGDKTAAPAGTEKPGPT